MHETAIDGDRNIERIFIVYYNVEQFKSLIVTCKQSEQIIWKHTWKFLADETMQTIPAAVHAHGDYR